MGVQGAAKRQIVARWEKQGGKKKHGKEGKGDEGHGVTAQRAKRSGE